MAERVCQFFLRGRCQRQKCEFRHPADQAGPRGPIAVAERSGGANKDTHCKFFLSTGCKFGTSCHFRHVGRERRRSRSGVCKFRKFRCSLLSFPHFLPSLINSRPLRTPLITAFIWMKLLLHIATFRSRERRSRSRSFDREVRMHRR